MTDKVAKNMFNQHSFIIGILTMCSFINVKTIIDGDFIFGLLCLVVTICGLFLNIIPIKDNRKKGMIENGKVEI